MAGIKGMKHKNRVSREEEINKRISELNMLYKLLREIKRNCAYSEKEMEADLARLQRLNVDEEEIALVTKLWELRRRKGRELFKLAEKLVEEIEEVEKDGK